MSRCTIERGDVRCVTARARRAALFTSVTLFASACRLGGPSGDPTILSGDASAVGGSGGQAGSGATGGSGGQGGVATGGVAGSATGGVAGNGGTAGESGNGGTGGVAGTGGTSIDASDDYLDGAQSDADLDGSHDISRDGEAPDMPPTGCLPPFSSVVCDPVCNTGCPALFRCDVTDLARTGVCVGTLLSTVPEGMPCTRSTVTDDCFERLSCIEATCRRLCYRDTDCTTSGTCCTGAIDVDGGASGYRYCAACGP